MYFDILGYIITSHRKIIQTSNFDENMLKTIRNLSSSSEF